MKVCELSVLDKLETAHSYFETLKLSLQFALKGDALHMPGFQNGTIQRKRWQWIEGVWKEFAFAGDSSWSDHFPSGRLIPRIPPSILHWLHLNYRLLISYQYIK